MSSLHVSRQSSSGAQHHVALLTLVAECVGEVLTLHVAHHFVFRPLPKGLAEDAKVSILTNLFLRKMIKVLKGLHIAWNKNNSVTSVNKQLIFHHYWLGISVCCGKWLHGSSGSS